MDLRSRKSFIQPNFSGTNERYPHCMQLYKEYPTDEISLPEFETFTVQRLSILQIIDEVSSKGLDGDEFSDKIISEIRNFPDLRLFSKLITGTDCGNREAEFQIRRGDHISHFVLQLAYCYPEDKRRWFISKEIELFKFRWHRLSNEQRAAFLTINNLNYQLVSESEKRELQVLTGGMVDSSIEYYKIPFTLVSDLISSRMVFLKKGFAYITPTNIIHVLTSSFRLQLSQSLSYVSRRLYKIQEDERLFPILNKVSNNVREVDYVMEDKEHVDIATLDDLCRSSYPLCMQNLHMALRQDHHLKYFGRQQYGLFLKGVGITLEDALRFWRMEFTKKMDSDKFDKQYSYNIRHNYGKEGKMANYTPHSCMRIITGSVNPGDLHGCVFKHKDPTLVKRMLNNNGINTIGTQEVLDQMRKHQYQLACSKYFQLKHNQEFAVNHPNAYFDESQRILKGKATKEPTSAVKSRPNQTPRKAAGSTDKPTPSKSTNNSDDMDWNDSNIDFASVIV